MTESFWWLADPQERYWVETLSERRSNLGRQLHAPQTDGAGQPNWRYELVRATRPGDVVLHWLSDQGTRAFVGWSIVAGPATSLPIIWHARGTSGRRRARSTEAQPGWSAPLTDFRALEQPVGLDALNEQRAEIASVHQELYERHGTPLYLALTLYQLGSRGVEVGQGYLFKWPAALNGLFPGLREIGQLTAGSPSEPAAPHPRSRRRPRSRDQRLNQAVEHHAVAVATAWYQEHGYMVENVGSRKSWDLEAAKAGELRRIEVKGSRPVRDAVDLTINELTNAHRWPATDLIVVDQIRAEVGLNGVITTSGGRVRCWQNWVPDDDSWRPVVVSHLLPERGHTEWSTDISQRHDVPAVFTDHGDEPLV
jgi:Domain of unknown function (DUF3883)